MILDTVDKNPGARFLFILACLVIVVAGLKAAAGILVPFALALFLAVISMPVMFWLKRHRIGDPLAIFLTAGLNVLIFGLIIMIAASSAGDLRTNLPRYQNTFTERYGEVLQSLIDRGVPIDRVQAVLNFTELGNLDWSALYGGMLSTLQTVASIFAMTFLVALITVFILAEATVFPYKFQAILGARRRGRMHLAKTIQEVQAYLGIKVLISLATGLTAGVFCWAMDLEFAVLLGITVFVLNFVPTIGSIIAAVPAMILAFILHDVSWTLLVGVGYFAINTLFGNILEPNLMGRRLGLSTLVIVLSLVFWFWVWGPIGALLSVPLTMVLKIVLENTPDLRWAAILLDKEPPQGKQRQKAQQGASAVLAKPKAENPDAKVAPASDPPGAEAPRAAG